MRAHDGATVATDERPFSKNNKAVVMFFTIVWNIVFGSLGMRLAPV